MRHFSRVFLTMLPFALTAAGAAAVARAEDGPRLVRSPVETIFVPFGFDDNDDAEVIIHGHFPNTCYKIGPISAKVDYATSTINVDAQSYLYPGECGQVLIPYIQSVKIGVLKDGTYKVAVVGTPQIESVPLQVVRAATSSADDFLYAPVETADLVTGPQGTDTIHLEGVWPYTFVGCMTMKQVEVEQTPGNVLVVRPIAEFADGVACAAQHTTHKFSYDTKLPAPLAAGEYLLHVRVLNGSSYNRFSTVERP